MLAILLMVVSLFVHQFEAIFIKKYNSKHSDGGYIFLAIVSLFSMLFFIITAKNGLHFTSPVIIRGIIAGLFYCLASISTYIALECGSYALTKLFMSYGILITIAQGFCLGEEFTLFKCIGIILILISIYCFSFNRTKSDKTVKITKKWIIYISATIIGSGVYGILQRAQQIVFNEASTNEFMITSLATSAIILFVAAIIKDGKNSFAILKTCIGYSALTGVANGATNFLNLVVYTLAPISYSAPVNSGLEILYSFLVSTIIFKEKFTKKQLVGVAIGCVAIVIMKF